MDFALNHITAPRLTSVELIDLAAKLGCAGVELRNDLADKNLTERPFFDGEAPAAIAAHAKQSRIRLLGLSEVYGFNRWSENTLGEVQRLVAHAKESGAESISLIPSNDGQVMPEAQRLTELRHALAEILPLLERANMIALVEPLGFVTSSLRHKQEAIDAINAVGGAKNYKLVHDTFHHFLAGEKDFFPEHTGIVHVSGVVDQSLRADQMTDGHRVLVNDEDRLGNVAQVHELLAQGYTGSFSYECFAASVHASPTLAADLEMSMKYIQSKILD